MTFTEDFKFDSILLDIMTEINSTTFDRTKVTHLVGELLQRVDPVAEDEGYTRAKRFVEKMQARQADLEAKAEEYASRAKSIKYGLAILDACL